MILARALNLREAIDEFCQDFEDLQTSHADDILTNKDWEVISDIKGFLEKLAHSTKALESPETCIDLTLPNFEFVMKIFEHTKDCNDDNPIIAPMINSR